MMQKFKNLIKSIYSLGWMKLWAAAILAACCYWLFSDLEIDFSKYSLMYLPWIYFYYTDLYLTKKPAILLVPLLMNMALWIPCQGSYLFLRIVLYTERVTAIVWAVSTFGAMFLRRLFFAHGIEIITGLLFISGIFILINELMLSKLETAQCKEKFSTNLDSEQQITVLTRKIAPVFYLAVYLLLSGNTQQAEDLPDIYVPIETRNVIFEDGKNLTQPVWYQAKLSRDEKMGLVKNWVHEDKDKNIFVVDLDSMKIINILPNSNVPRTNFNNNDYNFTTDGKYVVVANRILENPKIKFAVLDIATGEADPRFRDPQGLLENLTGDIDEVPFIRFNPSGDYFAVVSRVKHDKYRLEFWDYKQGKLIHVEEIAGQIADITWISDRKCIILYECKVEELGERLYNEKTQSFYNTKIKRNIPFVEQREILADGSVLATTKEKISADIKEEKWSNRYDFIENDCNGKYLSVFLSRQNVKVWEIETEKKIFSLNSDNDILDVIFHPDGQQLIVFECLKNGENRDVISFWDIAKNKKQKKLIIQSANPMEWSGNISLINNGTQAVLNAKKITIVSLEEVVEKTQ